MSRESRKRRRNESAAMASRRKTRKHWRWFAPVGALVLLVGLFTVWNRLSSRTPNKSQPEAEIKAPASYAELCGLNTNDLTQCDIALMNLLCAEGLRGAEQLNVTNCLATLDQMAAHVKFETERHLYKFLQNRAEYNNSER